MPVHFLGLVRNPMDTLYSSWLRFGVPPQKEEREWLRAYVTLLELKDRRPQDVTIVRYEDLIEDDAILASVLARIGVDTQPATVASTLVKRSLQKWRLDRRYGFELSASTADFAARFGYEKSDITNPNAGRWFWHRVPRAIVFRAASALPTSFQTRLRHIAARMVRGNAAQA